MQPARVEHAGRGGYGYGSWFSTRVSTKQAIEHAKRWELIEIWLKWFYRSISMYLHHFSANLDVFGLILMGKPMQVAGNGLWGIGMGWTWDTPGLPVTIPRCIWVVNTMVVVNLWLKCLTDFMFPSISFFIAKYWTWLSSVWTCVINLFPFAILCKIPLGSTPLWKGMASKPWASLAGVK